ncbi:hypothetical protein B5P43_15835 [Bacillus sp. SRB_336]|nr:hypothetical protein B5P43_15835 [Bacillus sp. SRB_336]
MKPATRITAAVTLTALLLGGGAAAALAEDGATPPAVQASSNVEPYTGDLTEEVLFKPGASYFAILGDGESRVGSITNDMDPSTKVPFPRKASAPIKAADNSLWRFIYEPAPSKTSYDAFYYVPESEVASSAKAGTYEAGAEAARKVEQQADDAYVKKFQGQAIIRGSWYEAEDASKPAVGESEGLGFKTEVTEPRTVNGQQWRGIFVGDANGKHTYYTPETNISGYEADAAQEPTAAPEATMQSTPEGTQAADAVSATVSADRPSNLGVAFGLGGLVLVAGGGYWIWDKKRKAVAHKAEAAADKED